jgi:murein DD-endopeptidase MepM/ murein hydrolase activator NlpD
VAGTEPATWASQELTKLIHSLRPSPASEKEVSASQQNPWKRILETPAELSSGFGVRKDPITGRQGHHPGIDLAVNPGTNIYSFKSGVVTFSGWQPAYGKIVVVRHEDGTETAYAHNARNLVKTGDQVTEHTQLAQVGATGRVTGPHLHFELRRDGTAVDPMPLFEKPSFQIAKAL